MVKQSRSKILRDNALKRRRRNKDIFQQILREIGEDEERDDEDEDEESNHTNQGHAMTPKEQEVVVK